ncbi:MAG TPA: hypothetical protein PLO89_07515 [Spirochaetota bacterium]|nr:hypothetical protein [Spirochaetota bacterium]
MYTITRKVSGYLLTFKGVVDENEMKKWIEDSKRQLSQEKSDSFGVIIDMENLEPLSPEAASLMKEGQKLYKEKGMNRSAVILNSPKICSQFKNIALQTGIYTKERYIDASSVNNPIELAINWIKDGVSPD